MEEHIGGDFSDVNIHTDSKAATMNASLGARAFMVGSDIFFNHGQWGPESLEANAFGT